MHYVVKAKELKWQGKTLLKGSTVEAKAERDHEHIALLAKIGKVEQAPEKKPVRQVASTKPAPEAEPVKEDAPEPVAEPAAEPVAPLTTEDFDIPKRTYSTRRMKAED